MKKETNKKQKDLIIKSYGTLSTYFYLFGDYELPNDHFGMYNILSTLTSELENFYINGEDFEIITKNPKLETEVEKDLDLISEDYKKIIEFLREACHTLDKLFESINTFNKKYEKNIEE